MALEDFPYWSERTPYWQGRMQQEEASRSAIATALMEEKLRQEELDRATRQIALDVLQGYGTPSERAAQLGGPIPGGIAGALRAGETVSNIEPEGGYSVGGLRIPGRRDIQAPTGREGDMIRGALIRKVLLGTPGELPEQTYERQVALERERYNKAEMLARSAETRAEKREIGKSERQKVEEAGKLEAQERKSQTSYAITQLGNRWNRLDQQDQAARNAYDKVSSDYDRNYFLFKTDPEMKAKADKRLENAGRTLEAVLAKNEQTRQTIDAQLRSLERELGIPQPEAVPGQAKVDPSVEFDTYMRGKLEPSFYAYLTSSGLDAREIARRAADRGVTPEVYLDALLEARNARAKKSK